MSDNLEFKRIFIKIFLKKLDIMLEWGRFDLMYLGDQKVYKRFHDYLEHFTYCYRKFVPPKYKIKHLKSWHE